MVRIPGFHPGDPGSSPGMGILYFIVEFVLLISTGGQEFLIFLSYITFSEFTSHQAPLAQLVRASVL